METDFFVEDPRRVTTAYMNDTIKPHRLAEGETISTLWHRQRPPFLNALINAYTTVKSMVLTLPSALEFSFALVFSMPRRE